MDKKESFAQSHESSNRIKSNQNKSILILTDGNRSAVHSFLPKYQPQSSEATKKKEQRQ